MIDPPSPVTIAPGDAALQRGPRPLPLFLAMLAEVARDDPELGEAALRGLAAYQRAERAPALPEVPVVARRHGAELRDYGGSGPAVVFVPSLINSSAILDLTADRSLLRWLASQGVRPLLVDWGVPVSGTRGDLGWHVEEILLPLLDAVGERAAVVGYCLGGTLALAAAAVRPPSALALIATPWRFSGYPDDARAAVSAVWRDAEPAARALGLLPIEVLQSVFWQLDERRTVEKYARFGGGDSEPSALFVAMEDWANGGEPLPYPAARALFEGLCTGDASGNGRWSIGGTRVDPGMLRCPVLDIVSTTDRIAPAASAAGIGERLSLAQGHVGMVAGGSAEVALWRPLTRWLRQHASS